MANPALIAQRDRPHFLRRNLPSWYLLGRLALQLVAALPPRGSDFHSARLAAPETADKFARGHSAPIVSIRSVFARLSIPEASRPLGEELDAVLD